MTPGRGFTLLEVVLAVVVLEIGILGVATTLMVASRRLSAALEREHAVVLAVTVLDSLRGAGRAGEDLRTSRLGEVSTSVSGAGEARVVVVSNRGDTLIDVRGWAGARAP